jgi:hypothetical protein
VTTPTTTKGRARPRIDPRIRERRIEVKRREGRRRLRVLVALLAVVLVVCAVGAATRSPLLDVDHVIISGANHTPVPAVMHAAGLDRHRLLIDVHADHINGAIGRLPWIASVTVSCVNVWRWHRYRLTVGDGRRPTYAGGSCRGAQRPPPTYPKSPAAPQPDQRDQPSLAR